ncbi:carboxypeptidase regulatory-like domain-containing protein, partial [candidate division KSB1 bacterium]
TTGSGYIDSVTFNLPLGSALSTDPTGPDAYGYFAYDNTDAAYEMSRPFQYINISAGLGTDLNINDVGEQPPTASTYTALRGLPFRFKFYGVEYNEITVCSNGWAAFGDHHEQDPFRNYPIPGQQAPDAMMAVFWDDLKTSGTGQGVWDYFQADSHRYVIQWKAQGAFSTSALDFEIVLLDPNYYPTRDGNGIIVYQYQQITESYGQTNDVPYSTVGIQAPGRTVGLQYRFHNTAASGGATLVAGRSIVFTTESRTAFGRIHGTITDAETQQPMPGVIVTLQGRSERDTTDAQGAYDLPSVLVGTYLVQAKRPGFNDAIVENVVVMMDSTVTLNFAMLHPEIATSVDHINVSLPNDPPTAYFNLVNDGNGPLDYQISVSYAPSVLDEEWSYLTGFDVSGATGDQIIQGCELVGDNWWVTGGVGQGEPKRFYRFDLNGNFVNSFTQPSTEALGWFDMAYDGQYVYGSSSNLIRGVDATGAVCTTIPSPLNPTRALAYDPATDHFWVADYVSAIYEITRTGDIVHQFSSNHTVTGLAWNPSDAQGYKLYVY